ncbi:hypothetical protein [Bacteroides xylanisolvens]|uniref:hypothetical protein n=1 Tax=Bacteroides xylanisolvens TaxID=371601 RepID=UPI0039B3FDF7
MEGKYATLKVPYMGYRNILILCQEGNRWTVEICDSGKIIQVYEDEFSIDT